MKSPLSPEEVDALSVEQKLALFDVLAESMQPAILQDFWPMEELEERCRLVDEGKMKVIPLEQAFDELRAEFKEWKETKGNQ
ncbi:addiction module protein [Phragmitibacter flavus]|uniref:addiction module protein n=1 Tax=Phragmitibacter flavus TaxID=2576071 RepID=UPI001980D27F|nr:addiction module protein [Phragmitibacter flavus]